MTESNLDRVIDDVARQMTSAEPRVDLRARVLDEIEQKPRWLAWKFVPIAVGTLAIAVLTVVALRTWRQAISTPGAQIAQGPASSPASDLPTASETPTETIARKIARSEAVLPSVVLLEWQERAISALPAPEPLVLESIAPEPLEIPELQTQPLSIAPINDRD